MALSFSEKRALQKTVATNLAALAEGKANFTEKRRLQKEITEAMAKLGEQAPAPKPNYDEWWGSVVRFVEDKIEISTSDAQGIVDAQSFIMQQSWGLGLNAEATADKVIAGSVRKPDDIDPAPANQDLLDLQAGKFDGLTPLAFLGKLKEIADAINDIEPLKAPAIAYIEKNSDKVSAIMESAVQEVFGRLWSAGAGA